MATKTKTEWKPLVTSGISSDDMETMETTTIDIDGCVVTKYISSGRLRNEVADEQECESWFAAAMIARQWYNEARQEYAANAKEAHEGHAADLAAATEGWQGIDAELVSVVEKLIRSGKAAQATAILKTIL